MHCQRIWTDTGKLTRETEGWRGESHIANTEYLLAGRGIRVGNQVFSLCLFCSYTSFFMYTHFKRCNDLLRKKIVKGKKPEIFLKEEICLMQLSWIVVSSSCLMWESLWPSEQETYGSMFYRALTCLRVVAHWNLSPSSLCRVTLTRLFPLCGLQLCQSKRKKDKGVWTAFCARSRCKNQPYTRPL